MVIAAADLVLWRSGRVEWATLLGIVPMAPASAAVFLVLGASLGMRLCCPDRPLVRRLSAVASGLAAAGSIHLIACAALGRIPGWESWIGPPNVVADGTVTGHMSVHAALLSLVSSFALGALFTPLAEIRFCRPAGFLAAFGAGMLGFLTLVSFTAGNPLFAANGLLHVSPIFALEVTLFNFGLALSANAVGWLRQMFLGAEFEPGDLPRALRGDRLVFGLLIPLASQLHAARYVAVCLGTGTLEGGFLFTLHSAFLVKQGLTAAVLENAMLEVRERAVRRMADRLT